MNGVPHGQGLWKTLDDIEMYQVAVADMWLRGLLLRLVGLLWLPFGGSRWNCA
jgi:hypothetical protein